MNQKPLTFGADIVMHSVTKYLAGHSDVILGSLSVKDPALHSRLHDARTTLGSIAGPFEVWLALRGIRTFPLRFQRAQESAAILAKKLTSH
ncbi:MAG: PLP-dependent transferase, partial [Candidatus Planktophila sp.]